MLRVLLVDDHPMVRKGLRRLLRGDPRLEIVGEAENGRSAIVLAQELHPDCILMDIGMPVMNGIEATRRIHARFPAMRIVGYSMQDDRAEIARILQAGADAFVSKSAPTECLLEVLRALYPAAHTKSEDTSRGAA